MVRVAIDIHQQAFAALNEWVPDPSGGLPEDFFPFDSRFTPLVNVDLWIRDAERRTLLTWRQDDTYGAGRHVPGGIIRYKETAEDRTRATARRERGHFVSLVYHCRLLTPPGPALRYLEGRPRRDQWAGHAACPPDLIAWQESYRRFF